MQHFRIDWRLPGLNEVLLWKRAVLPTPDGRKKRVLDLYAKKKDPIEQGIAFAARGAGMQPVQGPVIATVVFFDSSARDLDNILIGVKFIMDALKRAKILQDDSRKWVRKLSCHVVEDAHCGALVALGNRSLSLEEAETLMFAGRKQDQ